MNKNWISIGLVSFVLSGCSIIGAGVSDADTPKYDVISSTDDIEVRQYEPMIIAEVEVQGERGEAISDGFRLLADYIFGNNTVKESISMTAPVQQQANEKIAMTRPVQQQSAGDAWKVSFVMPSKYSMNTLPKPNNERVAIREVPGKRFVVIRFSGFNSDENISQHEEQLMQYIQSNNMNTKGPAKYAFYNPPWTIPFLRRNEVMFELEHHSP